ncbi:MAG: hypothetical protein ACKVVP_12395 [Chloroflexota bacterium]
MMPNHILVPLDGSSRAERPIPTVDQLTKALQAKVAKETGRIALVMVNVRDVATVPQLSRANSRIRISQPDHRDGGLGAQLALSHREQPLTATAEVNATDHPPRDPAERSPRASQPEQGPERISRLHNFEGRYLICRVIAIVMVLSLGWVLSQSPMFAQETETVAPSTPVSLETRTAQAGPVTIKVAPQLSDTGLTFAIVLDTHSVDLDRYDLSQLAIVRTNLGLEIQPDTWEAPKGGHHREGVLKFPLTLTDGTPLLGLDTHSLDLVIHEVGGVPETVIQWVLVS